MSRSGFWGHTVKDPSELNDEVAAYPDGIYTKNSPDGLKGNPQYNSTNFATEEPDSVLFKGGSLYNNEDGVLSLRLSQVKKAEIFNNIPLLESDRKDVLAAINAFLNDTLGKALNGGKSFSPSAEIAMKRLRSRLITRAKKIDQAIQRGEEINREIRQVNALALAWREFLKEFILAYNEFAPVKSEKHKYSTGKYKRSSIIYFTKDNESKDYALSQLENAVKSSYNEEFCGLSYVLLHLFDTTDGYEARTRRVLGGLTIENRAETDGYYYGWRNVEIGGWRRKAKKGKHGKKRSAYAPFQHALRRAKSEFMFGKTKCNLTYREVDA